MQLYSLSEFGLFPRGVSLSFVVASIAGVWSLICVNLRDLRIADRCPAATSF